MPGPDGDRPTTRDDVRESRENQEGSDGMEE
jgi:hypothetical protein